VGGGGFFCLLGVFAKDAGFLLFLRRNSWELPQVFDFS
jgi:hypothetical protein